MDSKIKKLPKSEIEITITVPEDKMHEFRKKACDEISKEVKVKGFRPGHVPPHVLENYVEKKYIDARTEEIAIQRTYAEVVIKENIQVVSRPKVKIEKQNPLVFVATAAVLPEVEVKDYKSIKIPKKEVKVEEKDIQTVITDMKKYGTTYKDVDRAAKKEDRVEVDFEGFDENSKPVPQTKSENHPVILGGESLIPGFEDQLIGMKKHEKKEFDIKFPKDYGKKEFQSRTLKFKTHVKRIEEPTIPELNEELIEKMTGKKQKIEDFKQDIEKNIKAKKEQEAIIGRENLYIEELLKKTLIEVPEALMDEEAQFILEDIKKEVSMKGIEFDKFLEQTKTTEDDLRKKYRPEAEKRIKIRLAIQFLIKQEKITVKDEEVKAQFDKIRAQYPPAEHPKIEKEFESGGLKVQLNNKIALGKLFEKVLN
jgi:trigger factor